MRVEARLIDGPRGGELFATPGLRPDLVFAQLTPDRSFWDWTDPALTVPTVNHRYEVESVVAFYRYAGDR